MGKISIYSAPLATVPGVQTFHPDDRGMAEVAQGGRRIGQLAQESGRLIEGSVDSLVGAGKSIAAAVDEHYGRQQSLDAGAEGLSLFNQLNSEWNARRNTADPHDPTVADKFNEEVLKPALEQFSNKYTATRAGQAAAESFQQRMFSHFAVTQIADQSTMAQHAAEQDVLSISNNSAALLMRDPTALDTVNGMVEDTITNYRKSNPNLTAEQGAHLDNLVSTTKRTNTLAAAHGMAETNPKAAEEAFKNGSFGAEHLSESDRNALIKYAQEQQRMMDAQDKADRVLQHQEDQQAAYKAADQVLAKTIGDDGALNITPDYYVSVRNIARMPGVAPGLAESLVSYGKRITAEKQQEQRLGTDDPNTVESFNSRVLLAPDDPQALDYRDIVDARAAGQLSDKSFARFKEDIGLLTRDPQKREALSQFRQVLNSMKSSITKSTQLMTFPEQDQQWGRFQTDMRARFDDAYRTENWRSLVDPKSKDYIGNDLSHYAYSTKQGIKIFGDRVRTGAAGPAPAVTPRKPGESLKDYDKRLNGGG